MNISDKAMAAHSRMFPGSDFNFAGTDPEFTERFANFAFDEVPAQCILDEHTRFLAILAVLLGCQGVDEFRVMMTAALNTGVTPVEVRETVYQATAYLGIGRVFPFIKAMNEVFDDMDIDLPLDQQARTTVETRMAAGIQAQVDIFGESIRTFTQSGPEETRHINRWLAANCFGDYYTRGGLDLRMREMITFCFIYAQGGCEPQLMSHIAANMRLGNDRIFLINVISQCVPYIGYPRSLNALRCVNEVAAQQK